jgi:hypothetical protein
MTSTGLFRAARDGQVGAKDQPRPNFSQVDSTIWSRNNEYSYRYFPIQ